MKYIFKDKNLNWKSNSISYFNGKCITGPDWFQFYLSLFLLIITEILFLIFVCPFFGEKYSIPSK
jgi:hypothetical protein